MSGLRRLAGWIPILVGAVAVALVSPIGPLRLVVVGGDSMRPTYEIGDLLLVRRDHHPDIGDIAVYRVPRGQAGAGYLVVHRVAGFDGNRYVFHGDNKQLADSWYPRPGDILGRPVARVPAVGKFAFGLSSLLVLIVVAGVAVVVLFWPSGEDADETPGKDRGVPALG